MEDAWRMHGGCIKYGKFFVFWRYLIGGDVRGGGVCAADNNFIEFQNKLCNYLVMKV